MVLCICRAVTERELEAAIASGATTLAAIAEQLGAGTDCGCCQDEIEERLAGRERACGRDCAGCPRSSLQLTSAA